jgi:hypothetical protein
MTEREQSDISKLAWQSQPIDAPTISLAFIHHHATKLNAQFRREMLVLYGAVILGIVVALVALLKRPPGSSTAMTYVTSLGVVLAIAGFIYVAVQARRRGGQVAIGPEESVAAGLSAYRTELQRRRDYYLGTWRWSIGPLLPSVAVFLIGGIWFDPMPQSGLRFGLLIIFVVIFSLLGALDHRRKAKAFQEELDAVDTLTRR